MLMLCKVGTSSEVSVSFPIFIKLIRFPVFLYYLGLSKIGLHRNTPKSYSFLDLS